MKALSSCLYKGVVMHHRFQPKVHRFKYKVFSLCLDLDELHQVDKLQLFSINRFNLFSFYEKQHGSGNGKLANYIRQLLIERGYQNATYKIKLLCYPKILGFTFNPLSTYFCYDKDNQLAIILYEVNNTFGSRHTYLFAIESKKNNDRTHHHHCEKKMYVSPFMPMQTRYFFRTLKPEKRVAICIQQLARQQQLSDKLDQQPILEATFVGRHEPLNDRSLVRAFCQYPLMTLKVICAIHWEALKLLSKKLALQPNQQQFNHSISWQDQTGVSRYEQL
jgi:DUF1365 family protein